MTEDRRPKTEDEGAVANGGQAPRGASAVRRAAIGCFTCWLGFVSGAMVAALLSKFASFLTRAQTCDGIPSCNWYIWALIGGLIGAVTLPILVLRVLGRPAGPGKKDAGF